MSLVVKSSESQKVILNPSFGQVISFCQSFPERHLYTFPLKNSLHSLKSKEKHAGVNSRKIDTLSFYMQMSLSFCWIQLLCEKNRFRFTLGLYFFLWFYILFWWIDCNSCIHAHRHNLEEAYKQTHWHGTVMRDLRKTIYCKSYWLDILLGMISQFSIIGT